MILFFTFFKSSSQKRNKTLNPRTFLSLTPFSYPVLVEKEKERNMQSGITGKTHWKTPALQASSMATIIITSLTVSPELHDAFNSFSSDASLFCLPVTITLESLTPLPPVSFSSSSSFYDSLPQLSPVLQPKTPIYLILRHGANTLIALTHIPSNAPVRSKTLFASTRATLVRDLGSENFATTVFTTEEEEVLSEQVWKERDIEGNGGGFKREDLMDERERELEAVRREEEEARSGTAARDVRIRKTLGKHPAGFAMPVDEDVRGALKGLSEGGMVQLVCSILLSVFCCLLLVDFFLLFHLRHVYFCG